MLRAQVSQDYFSSGYFNDLERPNGGGWLLDATVAGPTGPTGGILLTRGLGERDFDDKEREQLDRVFPALCKLLTPGSSARTAEPGDDGVADGHLLTSGTLILGRGLSLVAATRGAMGLVARLKEGAPSIRSRLSASGCNSWPAEIQAVVRRLKEVRAGRADPLPTLHARRLDGVYRISAQWLVTPEHLQTMLEEPEMQAEDRIQVTVDLIEPRVAKSIRLLLAHGLTALEIRVAQLIVKGHLKREIAVQLDISLSTVQSVSKAVFAKMQVSSAAELGWRLA